MDKKYTDTKRLKGNLIVTFSVIMLLTILRVIVDKKSVELTQYLFTPECLANLKAFVGCQIAYLILEMIILFIRSGAKIRAFTTIKNIVFHRLIRVKYRELDSKGTSDMLTYNNAAEETVDFIFLILRFNLRFIEMVVVLYTIYKYSQKLFYISLTICIIMTILYSYIAYRISKISKEKINKQTERNKILDDAVKGNHILKSFVQEDYIEKKYYKTNEETMTLSFKETRYDKISTLLINAFFVLFQFSVVFLYIQNYYTGNLEYGENVYYMLFMYVTELMNPFLGISDLFINSVSKGIANTKKLKEFFKLPIEDTVQGRELEFFKNNIEIKNLSFFYEGDSTVLDDVSINIKKGDKIGFVGKSGCGKSTLIKLLMRFLDTPKGTIFIDGVDITEFSLSSLRKHIGLISQDIYCTDDTVNENIRYGNPTATDDDIKRAANLAGCDFILNMKEEYETNIGPNGTKLSGGEKQRINIARAFLTNPDIFLLDEATAALDNESEYIINKSIDSFPDDKTVIIVAHRYTSVKKCDKIYVFDNGKIIESGTHSELMELKGHYYYLYKKGE